MKQIIKLFLITLLSTLALHASIQRVATNYVQIAEDGMYIGNALNQTYSIDPTAICNGGSITIIDQKGNNTIELVGGLTITSSQVVSNELVLTLSNETTVNIREAETFTYDVGANSALGVTGVQENFSTFVTHTLGLASVPIKGQGVMSGGSVEVSESSTTITTLKKTGQTTSYTAYDDGYYQTGVTPSYTRDDTNDIVTDNLTGLMWQDDTLVTKPWLTTTNDYTCL